MQRIDLTKGEITPTLIKLSMPIIGTSFIQMAYNLTDMMWLGRLDTKAVAGAGVVGYLFWVGMSIVLISATGITVNLAHAIGEGKINEGRKFIENGMKLNIIMVIMFTFILLKFNRELVIFFGVEDKEVIELAIQYLLIIATGLVLYFMNPIFSAIFNASGNSRTPFKVTSVGLIANMILDPIMIYHLKLGIKGAAFATVIAQLIVFSLYLYVIKKDKMFSGVNLLNKIDFSYVKRVFKTGLPTSIQSLIHALVSIELIRLLSSGGAVSVAVTSIGAQIESVSWMTAEGFSTAITAFVGQNYGFKDYERAKKGYFSGLRVLICIGIITSLGLILLGRQIFSIFTPNDSLAIEYGAKYLFIMGLSQVFMMTEIGTAGALNGLNKTYIPATSGIIFNLLRIPLAMFLITKLDFPGAWWSMSISSILKGITLATIMLLGIYSKRLFVEKKFVRIK